MSQAKTQCLILACGNTLRSDDGIGPWLAQWAQKRFSKDPTIRVIARQQWTPDLAEEIAAADSVLFIDCSIESEAGSMRIVEVQPSVPTQGLATHHQDAPTLLALASELYHARPRHAVFLTIGAGSTDFGEQFSESVLNAIPRACRLLEETVAQLLSVPPQC
jgi:hydrogenase maturation protease